MLVACKRKAAQNEATSRTKIGRFKLEVMIGNGERDLESPKEDGGGGGNHVLLQ